MITLQAPRFPRPVPIPRWSDDYTDIQQRIRRTGRLDREELYLDSSGDSWNAFCSRHGDYDFYEDWRGLADRIRQQNQRNAERAREKYRATVAANQAAWEAEQRKRQAVKQAQADAEWAAAEQRSQQLARDAANAEHRRRQAAVQQGIEPQTEQDWREVGVAKAWWRTVQEVYAYQGYRKVTVARRARAHRAILQPGVTYWLPMGVIAVYLR